MSKKSGPSPKELDSLYKLILKIPNKRMCRKFFRDLCTLAELKAMSERFEVMKRVEAGQSYREICKETGVSTATITRVAHWLSHGMGGYRWALRTIKSLTKKSK